MARLCRRLLLVVPALLCSAVLPPSAQAGIMVVVAHPDDDVILAAGVVHAARLRGERVTVVYATNGELVGGPVTGLARQAEAVKAQGLLGVNESDLVFLGYPDNRLADLYTNPAFAAPGAVLTSVHGQSVTFGNRGMGQADYHQHRFGTHASFNKTNMAADLVDLVTTYRPTHLITHADFDVHPDHRIVSVAVREAVKSVAAADPRYTATLFHGLVWSIDAKAWPLPANPATFLTEPPGLAPAGIRWVDRQSIDVPPTMQMPVPELNPKYLAINAHESQGGAGAFIGKSIHRDEVFWAENPLGADRPPRVDAGSPLTAAPGAKVTLDGSRSSDLDGALKFEWAQRAGLPVELAFADTARPSFTVPADSAKGALFTFGLVVSEGGTRSLEDTVTVRVGPPDDSAAAGLTGNVALGVAAEESPSQTAASDGNIAPLASVSASSPRGGSPQDASKAVDGVVDGYPTDFSKEWVTSGERHGAWLLLEWSDAHVIDRVVLHDRVNPTDNIASATLTFDDGKPIRVGALPANGGAREVKVPRISARKLRVKLTASPGTQNAGLAEIKVYESDLPADATPPARRGTR